MKIDSNDAYLRILVDNPSGLLIIVNTLSGLRKYKFLYFDLLVIPGIFP